MTTTRYADGYQAALADIAAALERGGEDAVREWLTNNRQVPGHAACADAAELHADTLAILRSTEHVEETHLAYNPATDRYETGGDEIEFAEEGDDCDDDEYDNPCEGHESLRGDLMGAAEYCDGSCKAARR